jgi:hypothetical protein
MCLLSTHFHRCRSELRRQASGPVDGPTRPLLPFEVTRLMLSEVCPSEIPHYSPAEAGSLRVGLPVSTTRFISTTSDEPDEVNIGSAVSTGRSKIEDFRDHERLRLSDDVIASDCPSPRFSKPRDKMFSAAFASLSISNPQAGHECSRTHNGLSDSTPHDAHSLVVPAGSTSTKCVPSRLQLYSSSVVNVSHAAEAVFRLFPDDSSIDFTSKSSTATKSYSEA